MKLGSYVALGRCPELNLIRGRDDGSVVYTQVVESVTCCWSRRRLQHVAVHPRNENNMNTKAVKRRQHFHRRPLPPFHGFGRDLSFFFRGLYPRLPAFAAPPHVVRFMYKQGTMVSSYGRPRRSVGAPPAVHGVALRGQPMGMLIDCIETKLTNNTVTGH